MRAALMGTVLAVVLAGCAGTSNPMTPVRADSPAFATKLLNLASFGNQWMSQANLTPNSQLNFTNQDVRTNATAVGAVASAVGDAAETYDLTNIGTLFAFVLVCTGVLVLRYKEPDRPRPFRVPLPTWALGVWVAFPIAIAIIALFVNGMDWMIGGLAGILTGPIAYLVFKNIYKGTTDDALEGILLTPSGELTELGAEVEGAGA